jgi:hypothetical protein
VAFYHEPLPITREVRTIATKLKRCSPLYEWLIEGFDTAMGKTRRCSTS